MPGNERRRCVKLYVRLDLEADMGKAVLLKLKGLALQYNIGNISEDDLLTALKEMIESEEIRLYSVRIGFGNIRKSW